MRKRIVHYDVKGWSNPYCGQEGKAPETTRVRDQVTCRKCLRRLERKWAR